MSTTKADPANMNSDLDLALIEARNSPEHFFRWRQQKILETIGKSGSSHALQEQLQSQIDAIRLTSASPRSGLEDIAGLLDEHLAALSVSFGVWQEEMPALIDSPATSAMEGGREILDSLKAQMAEIAALGEAIREIRAQLSSIPHQ